MTVEEIVREWLVTYQCDGLCHSDTECGCRLDDFVPCGELGAECEAACSGDPPDGVEGDFWMYPVAPEDLPQPREVVGKARVVYYSGGPWGVELLTPPEELLNKLDELGICDRPPEILDPATMGVACDVLLVRPAEESADDPES